MTVVVADVVAVLDSDVVRLVVAVDEPLELTVVVRLEVAELLCEVDAVVVAVEVAVVVTDDVWVVE